MLRQTWAFGVLALLPACSLLVSDELDVIHCSVEGSIGPPSCDAAQVCAAGRCTACLDREVCGDAIDNDCNGRAEDGCTGQAGSSGQSCDAGVAARVLCDSAGNSPGD